MTVWVRREPEDDQLYDRGTVVGATSDGSLSVKIGPKVRQLRLDQVLLDDGDSIDSSHMIDITQLSNTNEAAVADLVRRRYMDGEIYTYARPLLMAVNPFRDLGNTGPEHVRRFRESVDAADMTKPHIFGLAAQALRLHESSKRNVSFVISGESGAGKTETAKHIMSFIASGENVSDSVQSAVLAGNPILEAFGNAKTERNNNSSRFGRFVKLFLVNGSIQGGEISSYLLEKSRVTSPSQGERNFHVFYQLLRGLETNELHKLGLFGDVSDYRFLKTGCVDVPGKDDANDLNELVEAFGIIGLSADKIWEIFEILAAVLLIGQIEFVIGPDGICIPQDMTLFSKICSLLGIESTALLHKVTVLVRYLPGSQTVESPYSAQQATANLESLGRACYHRLFKWLIEAINAKIKSAEQTCWVGILDIFGFEFSGVNSLEQLLINFANEKLQQFFIKHVFELEKQIYESEGIDASDVIFEDNAELLAVIEGVNSGLFDHLESVCLLQSGTVQSFIGQIFRQGYNPEILEKPKKNATPEKFVIHHTAASVVYDASYFRDKNMDKLIEDVHRVIITSSNSILREGFSLSGIKRGSADGEMLQMPPLEKQLTRGQSSVGNKMKGAFTASQFGTSMNELMILLTDSEPFFVRCVKPNDLKKPGVFNNRQVIGQLHSLSIMEAINLARKGFGYRKGFADFVSDFSSLEHGGIILPSDVNIDSRNVAESLVRAVIDKGEPIILNDVRFGRTMIFLKKEAQQGFENFKRKIHECMRPLCRSVRNLLSSASAKSKFNYDINQLIKLQSALRAYQGYKAVVKQERLKRLFVFSVMFSKKAVQFLYTRQHALVLQSSIRNLLAMRSYGMLISAQEKNKAVSTVQLYAKTLEAIESLKRERLRMKETRACSLIQKEVRNYLTKQIFRRSWLWRMLVWPIRRVYLSRKKAAERIQAAWRGSHFRAQDPSMTKLSIALKNVRWRLELDKGIVPLQTYVKGFLERRKFRSLCEAVESTTQWLATVSAREMFLTERDSAEKIQCAWKGFKVRVDIIQRKCQVLWNAQQAMISDFHQRIVGPYIVKTNLNQLRAQNEQKSEFSNLLNFNFKQIPPHGLVEKITSAVKSAGMVSQFAASKEALFILHGDRKIISAVSLLENLNFSLNPFPVEIAQIEASDHKLFIRSFEGNTWLLTLLPKIQLIEWTIQSKIVHIAARIDRFGAVDMDGKVYVSKSSKNFEMMETSSGACKIFFSDKGDFAALKTGGVASLFSTSQVFGPKLKVSKICSGNGFAVALIGAAVFEWGDRECYFRGVPEFSNDKAIRVQPSNMKSNWLIEDLAVTGDKIIVRLHSGDLYTWGCRTIYVEKESMETLADPGLGCFIRVPKIDRDMAFASNDILSIVTGTIKNEEIDKLLKITEKALCTCPCDIPSPKRATKYLKNAEIAQIASKDTRVKKGAPKQTCFPEPLIAYRFQKKK